ncbi:von Willebrand factor A domain-containing protein 5A-like isoform X2 [Mya arenaria]|uniref:von Willebrand factor A domain-containing protein 5A-like isoform X2 n=1 Tax=Mya arenaria TaxID=6604 RepID=UPI0022E331ED|nr:von Willebrand factor A domain-containing protein 5A-like isoform X2 [Mya arenaria]
MNLFGLSTDKGTSVPLKSIDVNVTINGYLADVVTSLGYYNSEYDPVEAMFTFPVDDGSAVYQFEGMIDGRRVVAEIQEKEQSGKSAMLLKEDTKSSDTFQCMLGNLPAGKEAELRLSYVNELPQEEDGRVRFTLPTVLNPRYCPDAGSSSVAAEGADYVPPSSVPYNFKMTVTIEGYHGIKAVSSDKISLDVKLESGGKLARFEIGEEFKFDHDLCLLVEYAEPFAPQVILENGDPEKEGLLKEDMLMVSFHPELKEVAMATSGEYVFIIDRSGSMDGSNMKNAKEALLLFLKSLPVGCYFNVVSFGSMYDCLFNESKHYSERTLNEALMVLANMDADMGGTEIYKPLEYVLREKVQQQPRNVFLLTDGRVGNTEQVIGLISKHSYDTRVFAVGVGSGVSTFLVNGVVRAGKGLAEFIADDERIQPKVVSLLKCAMQMAVTNIELTWDLPPGVTPISIPTDLPVMLTVGQRLTFFAMIQRVDVHTIYATSKLTLKGKQDNNPVTFDLLFTLSENENSSATAPVHRLATKTQIKLLQDEEAALCVEIKDDYYNPKENIEKVEEIRNKIVGVSRHGNIVSKYTSFVAVDTEGEQLTGELKTRQCPVPTSSEEFLEGIDPERRNARLEASLLEMNCKAQEMEMRCKAEEMERRNARLGTSFFETRCCKEKMHSENRRDNFWGKYMKPMSIDPSDIDRDSESLTLKSYIPHDGGAARRLEKEKKKKKKSKGLGLSGGLNKSKNMVPSFQSKKKKGSSKPEDLDIEEDDYEKLQQEPHKPGTNREGVSSDEVMLNVITLQKLGGNWSNTTELASLLQIPEDRLKSTDIIKDCDVLATLIVVSWLRSKYTHRQEEWQMIETKALAWLGQQNLEKPVEELLSLVADSVLNVV